MRGYGGLQLKQVRRLERSRNIDLQFDDSIVDHFVTKITAPSSARESCGADPAFDRERACKEMLKGDIKEGPEVVCK